MELSAAAWHPDSAGRSSTVWGASPIWDFWQCRPLQALHIKQPVCCWHMAGKIPPLGCLCISLHCLLSRRLPVWGPHLSHSQVHQKYGTQSHLALFSIRNEYIHIVAYYFTHTTSLMELQEGLQKQYEAAGSKAWPLGTQTASLHNALTCSHTHMFMS